VRRRRGDGGEADDQESESAQPADGDAPKEKLYWADPLQLRFSREVVPDHFDCGRPVLESQDARADLMWEKGTIKHSTGLEVVEGATGAPDAGDYIFSHGFPLLVTFQRKRQGRVDGFLDFGHPLWYSVNNRSLLVLQRQAVERWPTRTWIAVRRVEENEVDVNKCQFETQSQGLEVKLVNAAGMPLEEDSSWSWLEEVTEKECSSIWGSGRWMFYLMSIALALLLFLPRGNMEGSAVWPPMIVCFIGVIICVFCFMDYDALDEQLRPLMARRCLAAAEGKIDRSPAALQNGRSRVALEVLLRRFKKV